MPTTSVPGVIVIEDAIAVISKSDRQRSGSSTIAGVAPSPGVKVSCATAQEPLATSTTIQPM